MGEGVVTAEGEVTEEGAVTAEGLVMGEGEVTGEGVVTSPGMPRAASRPLRPTEAKKAPAQGLQGKTSGPQNGEEHVAVVLSCLGAGDVMSQQ